MMNSSENINLRPREFDGLNALSLAWDYLDIHAVIALVVALSFSVVMFFIVILYRNNIGMKWYKALYIEFCYLIACATFGVVTAYFLSLGLKRAEDGQSVNGLIESFAAPFVSLLAASAAILIAKEPANAGGTRRPIMCAACFLCATAISYRTFFYQILSAF